MVLNRPKLEQVANVPKNIEMVEENIIPSGPISKAEIRSAISGMSCGKEPGEDNITAVLLKADLTTTVDVLHNLFYVIWDNETDSAAYWDKGLIVKLAKKGDLTECGNWKGITLMSVVAKVMGSVLIRRIAAGVEVKLRKEQAGFRKGRKEHDRADLCS